MAALAEMVKDSFIHSFTIDAYYHWYSIIYQYLLVQYGLLPKIQKHFISKQVHGNNY